MGQMTTAEIFERLGLALAIGILFGIERGWQEREGDTGSAGVRTYAMVGLLGGVWGFLAPLAGPVVLGFAALAFAVTFALFQWQELHDTQSHSAVGMVAGLLAFALGAYAVLGSRLAAGSAAVAATFILAERRALHGFVERLTWPELRSSLLLLIMTVVFLPVLPDRTIDPWGAFNPFQVWLITVIIGAVSFVGYVAVRLAGTRNGLLYAGVAGGLVSSTTVTWRFAALARHESGLWAAFVSGIAASWCVSLVRVLAIAFVISPPLALNLAKPLGFALIVVATASAIFYRFAERGSEGPELKLDNPFDIGETLRFGALLSVVLIASKWALAVIGNSGLIALASISGLADVDPITLSMGQAAGHSVTFPYAAVIVLIATAANTLTRCVLAWSFGGVRLGAIMTTIASAGVIAGLIGLIV
jgi:uncharacterized membrane protein (DUF4010 family)